METESSSSSSSSSSCTWLSEHWFFQLLLWYADHNAILTLSVCNKILRERTQEYRSKFRRMGTIRRAKSKNMVKTKRPFEWERPLLVEIEGTLEYLRGFSYWRRAARVVMYLRLSWFDSDVLRSIQRSLGGPIPRDEVKHKTLVGRTLCLQIRDRENNNLNDELDKGKNLKHRPRDEVYAGHEMEGVAMWARNSPLYSLPYRTPDTIFDMEVGDTGKFLLECKGNTPRGLLLKVEGATVDGKTGRVRGRPTTVIENCYEPPL